MKLCDQIIKLFLKGKSKQEISKILKKSESHVGCELVRKGYRTRKEIFTQNNKVKISKVQEEILIGKLLGDGYINNKRRLQFIHGEKQEFYINHLGQVYKNFICKISKRINKGHFIKEKWCPDTIYYQLVTRSYSNIEDYYNLFYNSGKKKVTKEIIDLITPRSIAYWYMDDGHCTYYSKNSTLQCSFATNAFNDESINLLIEMFKERYNIEFRKTKSNTIMMKQKSFRIFRNLIKKYVLREFYYKLKLDWK